MTLYEKILNIYPELNQSDFEATPQNNRTPNILLQNDGEGDYIKEWNHPTLTKPTEEQLDGVSE